MCAALEAKDEDAAEALLDGEADPNEVDGIGMNALHRAAGKACLSLFPEFSMIRNVNAVQNGGYTALMIAARFNHLDMVVSLMNHPGIDVNVQDSDNSTALHLQYQQLPAILAQLVSDDRVDTSLKDNTTEHHWGRHWGHDECEKILRSMEPRRSE